MGRGKVSSVGKSKGNLKLSKESIRLGQKNLLVRISIRKKKKKNKQKKKQIERNKRSCAFTLIIFDVFKINPAM